MRRSSTVAMVVVVICAGIVATARHTMSRPLAASLRGIRQSQATPVVTDKSSFLIARRKLDEDPLFGKSVVLMLPVVDKVLVIGLIVNRPTRVTLHELFPKNSAFNDGKAVAYFGGPVDVETAGVLFRSDKAFKQAFHLSGDLYVSFDADLIDRVLKTPKEVTDVRLFLGRSQWGPDQLAREMERGSWFGEKEENGVIFRTDSANVWIELIGRLEPENVAEWGPAEDKATLSSVNRSYPLTSDRATSPRARQ